MRKCEACPPLTCLSLVMFQSDMMAQDFKRTVARLQMDNDKLEKDLDNFAEKERQYLHQIKETEDRVSLSKDLLPFF